jgi:protein involved in sex pheromone biosynthesis
LYRQFLGIKLGVHNLPKAFIASPQNSLLKELQAAYLFIDPATYSSEATREFLYKNPKFLHYIFLKDFLKTTNNVFLGLNINFNSLSNYFIQLIGYRYDSKNLSRNYHLYKSQYRPMKKSVVNMIRLQATNAIAMPTEIRLHLLASSKDVIHS